LSGLGCRVHVRGRSIVRKRGIVYRRRSVRRHKCCPLLTGIVREDRLAGEGPKSPASPSMEVARRVLTDLLQFRGCFDPFYSVGVREDRKM
jgi:hypothetical protein